MSGGGMFDTGSASLEYLSSDKLPNPGTLRPDPNTLFIFGRNEYAIWSAKADNNWQLGLAKNGSYFGKKEGLLGLQSETMSEAIVASYLEIEDHPPLLNLILFHSTNFTGPNSDIIYENLKQRTELGDYPNVLLWDLGNRTQAYRNASAYVKTSLQGKPVVAIDDINRNPRDRFASFEIYAKSDSEKPYRLRNRLSLDPGETAVGLRYNPELMQRLTILMQKETISPAFIMHIKPQLDELGSALYEMLAR